MVKDLAYLGNLMDRVAKAVILDANALQNSIAANVHRDVVEGTPVDVGTARSNWVMTLDSPYALLMAAFSPHASRWRPPHASPGSDTSETQNLEAAVRQAKSVLEANKTGKTIYIVNNLPYISVLNDGHSKQAPAGFVQAAISTGVSSAVTLFRFKNIESLFVGN